MRAIVRVKAPGKIHFIAKGPLVAFGPTSLGSPQRRGRLWLSRKDAMNNYV